MFRSMTTGDRLPNTKGSRLQLSIQESTMAYCSGVQCEGKVAVVLL
jgi:hypothetical protein